MKDSKTHLLITIALIMLGGCLFALIWGIHNALGVDVATKYNCGIAEISPEYTPAMRAECRNKSKESTK